MTTKLLLDKYVFVRICIKSFLLLFFRCHTGSVFHGLCNFSWTRWTFCLGRGRLRRRCWGRTSERSTEPWENWTASGWSWSSRRRRSSPTSRKWLNRDRWWGRGGARGPRGWGRSLTACCFCSDPSAGRGEDHGQRPGPNTALREEVHRDESQHPGCQPEDPDAEVQQQHGAGDERRHQSHGNHEQTGVFANTLRQTITTSCVWPCGFPSPQLKLPQIQKIMMEFEKQSELMDMKEEMMNDAIDDAMGDEDDEEER